MEDFNPRNVNGYSVEQLIAYIDNGAASFEDFQKCGLKWDKQAEVKKILDERAMKKQREEQDWQTSRTTDTIPAYNFYLNTYGEDTAIHAFEAKMRIQELIGQQQRLYEELFADMRDDMMKYKANVMQVLFGKVPPTDEMRADESPIGRFLRADMKLTFDDLHRSGILPEGNRALEKAIFKDDFEVPQFTIKDLGSAPNNRTDVYFLGCPASGKSCVLAGFLNHLHFAGEIQYLPTKNERGIDGCLHILL